MQFVDLAEHPLVGPATIENCAHRRSWFAAGDTPAWEAHAVHAARQEYAAVAQDLDGQCLADTAAPLSRSAGIRADVVLHEARAALCLDQFDRLVLHVVEIIVPHIGAITAIERASAAPQWLDHFDDTGIAIGRDFGERDRYHGAA